MLTDERTNQLSHSPGGHLLCRCTTQSRTFAGKPTSTVLNAPVRPQISVQILDRDGRTPVHTRSLNEPVTKSANTHREPPLFFPTNALHLPLISSTTAQLQLPTASFKRSSPVVEFIPRPIRASRTLQQVPPEPTDTTAKANHRLYHEPPIRVSTPPNGNRARFHPLVARRTS